VAYRLLPLSLEGSTMKVYITLLAIAVLAAGGVGGVGCEKKSERASTTETTGGTIPDNTRMNERDRDRSAATPMDQKNNADDLETTQAIRKAVMADDSLSATAKNVKIITENGVVTLRGVVKTEAEKKAIEAKARSVGSERVDNQIDVESSK
jgi:osmotically-inducible protein OsmY